MIAPQPIPVGLVIGQLSVGGAEGQLAELVAALDRRFQPFVYSLTAGEQPLARRLERAGATVRVVGGSGLMRARRLAAVARRDSVRLLHSWLFIANAYSAATRLFGLSVPLITSARNCKVQDRINQVANVIAFRLSAAIVVNSGDVAEFVTRQYAAPRGRIRTVYNGVDALRFAPSPTAPPTPQIVTVGRMVRQKNHESFLRAAALVARQVPECRFTLVGDGPLRAGLERQAADLGLAGKVQFAGERRDVETVLATASLFWLTSLWEGMPNAVLEAMASGVPVIAADVGGVREIVRGEHEGRVVAVGDEDALAERTVDLLRDERKRSELAAAARLRAEDFAIPKMADTLAQLYDQVLAKGSQ